MTKSKPSADAKGRRDHYVPQGYLRGFIHPERQDQDKLLWVLDVKRGKWSEKSPSQIGWERGFYDYTPGSNPEATADDTFRCLENDFPVIRDRIRKEGYTSWIRHWKVLVEFAVMMAARSPLFREQVLSQQRPSLATSLTGDGAAKDFAITLMMKETSRNPQQWNGYDWVLRHTNEPENSFIVSDQVVGMKGNAPTLAEAVQTNDFWLFCPLSWDMCLLASSQPLDADLTAPHQLEHVAELQTLMKRQARKFVASPVQIPGLTSG